MRGGVGDAPSALDEDVPRCVVLRRRLQQAVQRACVGAEESPRHAVGGNARRAAPLVDVAGAFLRDTAGTSDVNSGTACTVGSEVTQQQRTGSQQLQLVAMGAHPDPPDREALAWGVDRC